MNYGFNKDVILIFNGFQSKNNILKKLYKMKKAGWIGLGNMGFPMVINLLSAKYEVNIYTSNQGKANNMKEKGANISSSIINLAENSDIIFLMLPDDNACQETLDKMKSSDLTGKLIVNMSTVSPQASIRFNTEMKERNANYFEAPVSGSVKPATEGTLTILAAGRKEDLDSLTDYFDVFGKKTFYLEEIGKALYAKMVINYYMSVIVCGLADSVLFAEKLGLKDNEILDMINSSASASGMTQMKAPAIINREFKAAFPLKYMRKDLKLSKDIGLASPLGNLMLELYGQANENYGQEDLMAILSYMENKKS